jgi:putative transposase
MAEHVGYDKHDPAGRNGENSRNGKRTKAVLTELAGAGRRRLGPRREL